MKHSIATGDAVLRAYSKSVKRFEKEPSLVAASSSAGFIIPDGQKGKKKKGYQVFVKVARFSEELLEQNKRTGGLLENK